MVCSERANRTGTTKAKQLACIVLSSAMLCAATSPVLAQTEKTEITFLAGPSFYDLVGTGTGFEFDTGFSFRPTDRILVLEPTVAFFTYESPDGEGRRWLFYELSLQAEGRAGRVRPYVGAGLGGALQSVDGDTSSDLTLHLAGGARLDFGDGYIARGEVRLRSIDPWNGSTVFLGFGLGWRF